MEIYNVYCDESCHIVTKDESKKQYNDNFMAIGAIWCPLSKTKQINDTIKEIKSEFGETKEIKWSRIGKSQLNLIESMIDYFFAEKHLHYRCYLIKNKYDLNHEHFGQTQDDFYYKSHYRLIEGIIKLNDCSKYNIYLDRKDTLSVMKYSKLHDFLNIKYSNNDCTIVQKVQQILSHEVEIMQFVDLFTGAIVYKSRELKTSEPKISIIDYIENFIEQPINQRTSANENKFNIFDWDPNYNAWLR